MIIMSQELIRPKKQKNDPSIGSLAVMAATENDLSLMRRSLGVQGQARGRILTSRLFKGKGDYENITLVGPMLGAPCAVMVLEKLVVCGAETILFLGWCGSVRERVEIGDLVIPDCGIIGEGTSKCYLPDRGYSRPSRSVVKGIEKGCRAAASIPFHKGPVWSTDAPYRETRQMVRSVQIEGVLGVDMEVSALFTVGRFRGVKMGALLVVSDELGSLKWKPGFLSKRFRDGRRAAAKVVCQACRDFQR